MVRKTTVKKAAPKKKAKPKTTPAQELLKEAVIAAVKPKRVSKPRKPRVAKEKPVKVTEVELVETADVSQLEQVVEKAKLTEAARIHVADIEVGDAVYTETIDIGQPESYEAFGLTTLGHLSDQSSKVLSMLDATCNALPDIVRNVTNACNAIVEHDMFPLTERRAWYEFWKPNPVQPFKDWVALVVGKDGDGLAEVAVNATKYLQRTAISIEQPTREFHRMVGMYQIFEKLVEPLNWVLRSQTVPDDVRLDKQRELLLATLNSFSMLRQDDWKVRFENNYVEYTKLVSELMSVLFSYAPILLKLKEELDSGFQEQVLSLVTMSLDKRAKIKQLIAKLNKSRDELLAYHVELSKAVAYWAMSRQVVA